MYREELCLILQFCIDPFHIVVVHKIIELQSIWLVASHLIEAADRMCNFKIVVIVVPGVQCFDAIDSWSQNEEFLLYPTV